jgi:hypothetical protein
MKPIRTPRSDVRYVLSGGTEENDLWAEQAIDGDGSPVIASTWTFTDDERAAITAGANIELIVHGTQHPPVGMLITDAPGGPPPCSHEWADADECVNCGASWKALHPDDEPREAGIKP